MKKLYPVCLTAEQRSALEQLVHSGTHKARVLARARVLLLADRDPALPDQHIAQALLLGPATVVRTRKHFVTAGLHRAVYGLPQPGRPPRITGEVEAGLVMLACSSPPAGRARWTLQLLADKLVELHYVERISDQQVHNMLKKTHLSLGGSKVGASPSRAPAL